MLEPKQLIKIDFKKYSVIEGGIGPSQRWSGLQQFMIKLTEISKSVIGMTLFVLNDEKPARPLCYLFVAVIA